MMQPRRSQAVVTAGVGSAPYGAPPTGAWEEGEQAKDFAFRHSCWVGLCAVSFWTPGPCIVAGRHKGWFRCWF